MPRISKEESDVRRNQVIDACAELFRTQGYHETTIAQIAAGVPFGRANIYNYFQNKDEVFLALLRRENEQWAEQLATIRTEVETRRESPNDESLARALAASVEERTPMLKLLATSIFDMEQFSRPERLLELKIAYKATVEQLQALSSAAKPSWSAERVDRFVFAFLPLLHGVYPYAFHSDKQLTAMREAGIAAPDSGVHELVYNAALALLQSD